MVWAVGVDLDFSRLGPVVVCGDIGLGSESKRLCSGSRYARTLYPCAADISLDVKM